MIYRIIGEEERHCWDEDGNLRRAQGRLSGACLAGFGGFEDLPYPSVSNPRARFWFTEAGWQEYGREVMKCAMQSGRPYRLLRTKNPPRSAIVYRDRWQVALLPVKSDHRS